MTRRLLIRKIGLTVLAAFWGESFLSFFCGPACYRVVIYNVSPNLLDAGHESDVDFWGKNDDKIAKQLNEDFIQSGRLLHVKSFLGKDRRSVVLVKYYRSKQDHLDYVNQLAAFQRKEVVESLVIAAHDPSEEIA